MMDSEKDPNGIDQRSLGAKLDSGKPLPFLVLSEFSRALMGVTQVGTYGASKYTPRGWLHVKNGEARYKEAAMLHLLQLFSGQYLDLGENGSGLPHFDMVIWNLLAARELQLRAKEYEEEQMIDSALKDLDNFLNSQGH